MIKLNFFSSVVNLGEVQAIVPAYITQENKLDAKMNAQTKIKQENSTKGIVIAKNKKKLTLQSHTDTKKEKMVQTEKKEGNGRPISELIALLHAAIQKEQRYPESAIDMQREGNTTVRFTLFPNGEINQLIITKSSGTAALDQAALLAVNKAVPFKGVSQYLSKPQSYQITVVFELT